MEEFFKKNYRKIALFICMVINVIISFILVIKGIKTLVGFESDGALLAIIPLGAEIYALIMEGIGISRIVKNKFQKFPTFIIASIVSLLLLILSKQFPISGLVAFEIIKLIISLFGTIFLILNLRYLPKPKDEEAREEGEVRKKTSAEWTTLILNIVIIITTLSVFFIPFLNYNEENIVFTKTLLSSTFDALPVISAYAFLALFIVLVVNFTNSLSGFVCSDEEFGKKSKANVVIAIAIVMAFCFAGRIISFIPMKGKTLGYVTEPLVLVLTISVLAIVHSVFVAKCGYSGKEVGEESKSKVYKAVILVFAIIMCLLTFGTLFIDIVKIKFVNASGNVVSAIEIKGLDLLKKYADMKKGFKLMAYVLFVMLSIDSALLLACIISFISKSKYFKGLALVSVVLAFIFSLLIGLFGLYYKIINELDKEVITSLLEAYGLGAFSSLIELNTKIESSSMILFLCNAVIGGILLVVRPFTKFDIDELGVLKIKNMGGSGLNGGASQGANEGENVEVPANSFDACPAFTEIDGLKPSFDKVILDNKNQSFENPTLPNLVKFIVDYARESRLHLSYSLEDIATFIAGLGTTRLSILQGMSGTGKTSLPKIFMEAVKGNCEIVEVESSWKDKNELLGYYNEFSKVYTPKKFTQALYKASLNPEIITFIVLDEMNLSRIEYYFSDFLSLMENEEDKREIKLLNVKLYNTYDNEKHSYIGLKNDHTIKIPTNVWFIGTANRDESTFEISDKVYDRAYTMNFNKRAPKVKNFMEPIPQAFVSYETFRSLVNTAINEFEFDLDDYEVIKNVEKLLQPYNISFGNRVAKQIEEFVKVYCSCFNNPKDLIMEALEKILLSKVVSKLEFKSIENKEELVREFEKLKLYSCSEFISKINEDF